MNTTTEPQPEAAAPVKKSRFRRTHYLFAGGVMVLTAGVLGGFVPRLAENKVAAADTQQLAVPTVLVVSPAAGPPPDGLILPAEISPWQEASIYSRVNGYLKNWLVDIGAHVSQDQLLAEIDTPDLDHQLEQARSQAKQAEANYELAKSTNAKYQQLWDKGVVSKIDWEDKATAETTNQSNAAAFAANLRLLQQDVAFKRVTAPFPGIITARHTNVGDLIVANNTSMEMFHLQQTDPLRIYFRIPQGNVGDVKDGQPIDVVFQEPEHKTLQAKVATTSESITPTSRTLLVELHLANPDNKIQPGTYAEIRLPASSLGTILTLPDTSLLFRAQGLQVGVVKPDNTVELRDIKVGRDFGTRIEILGGVSPSDRVVNNPSDSLVSGTVVRVTSPVPALPSSLAAAK